MLAVVVVLRYHGTVACQVPLSMGFPRQEYWSGLPFPSPGDLPDPGIEPVALHCRQIFYLLNYEEILAASKLNQKLGNRAHHPQYNLFSCYNLMFF